MINKKLIGNRIKDLRVAKFGDKRGAPRGFADFLGIPYTTYRDNEAGKIGAEVLIAIEEKLGVTGAQLQAEDEKGSYSTPADSTPPRTADESPASSDDNLDVPPQDQIYLDKLKSILSSKKLPTIERVKSDIDYAFDKIKPPEKDLGAASRAVTHKNVSNKK